MSTLKVDAITNTSDETRYQPTTATAQATTSGTAFDFTGIPSWVTKISVLLDGNSLSGTDDILVQLGDAGGFETASYVSGGHLDGSANGNVLSTAGFVFPAGGGTRGSRGIVEIRNVTGNQWLYATSGYITDGSSTHLNYAGGGDKALSDTLTQLRVTRTGSDTFDAGQVNIIYE